MSESHPRIPDYSFPGEGLIGEGAYGWVWLGLFKGDQPRAVKVFKPRAIQEELWRGEYEKLRALDEPPGVVTLYDAGHTEEGQPYVSMRLMADRLPQAGGWRGRTLAQSLLDGGLSTAEGWRLMRETAETLAFVHRNQVRHCDLKPGNILLSSGDEPRPVLCDFGQSRRRGDLADSGLAPGTALYACPDQLRHPDQPKKSWDVYSFGVTAYRVLSGRLPRLQALVEASDGPGGNGDSESPHELEQTLVSQRRFETGLAGDPEATLPSVEELARQIEAEAASGPPIRPEGLTDELSDAFQIVERCLQLGGQSPSRYADMEEVVAALKEADRQRLIAVERRKKLVFVALTAFGLTAAVLAGWKSWTAERAQAATEVALVKMGEARDQSEASRIAELEARQRAEVSEAEADRQKQAAVLEAQRARDSERRTLESEALAQLARHTAERLINRMLYDLRAELDKLGRADLLDGVSGDAEEYFANLPEAFRTDASERERSTMLNNRGDDLLVRGDAEAALKLYRDSLEVRRQRLVADVEDDGRMRDVAVSLERVGDALSSLGHYEAAAEPYGECLEIRRRRAASEATEAEAAERARDLCISLVKLGDLHVAREQLEEAEAHYAEALDRLRPLVGVDPARRRDLSAALVRMGDLLQQTQRSDAAREHYELSLAGLRDLRAEAPEDLSILRDISALGTRLGAVLAAAGETERARQVFEEGCAALEVLVERDPTRTSWAESLAAMLGGAGDAASDEDPEAAEKFYLSAVDRYQSIIDTEQSPSDAVVALAVTHYKLAGISRRHGAAGPSIEHYDAAILLLEKLRAEGNLDTDKEAWIAVLSKEREELR